MVPGKPVLKDTAENGCTEKNGSTLAFVSFDCKDGRTVVASDLGMGYIDGVWMKGGTGSGPGDAERYSAAVAKCNGF